MWNFSLFASLVEFSTVAIMARVGLKQRDKRISQLLCLQDKECIEHSIPTVDADVEASSSMHQHSHIPKSCITIKPHFHGLATKAGARPMSKRCIAKALARPDPTRPTQTVDRRRRSTDADGRQTQMVDRRRRPTQTIDRRRRRRQRLSTRLHARCWGCVLQSLEWILII